MMLAVFFFISLSLNAVNGLEMCVGSYKLPEVVDVTTTPVYEYRNVINEVKVSVAVRSRSPAYMDWYSLETRIRAKQITEDTDDARLSVTVSNDRYLFKLHTKLEKTVTNITEIFDDFHLSLHVMYDCNSIALDKRLGEWIKVAHASLTTGMPKITLLPRGRYVIDGDDFSTPKLRLRFSRGPEESPPMVDAWGCRKILERRNGRLRITSMEPLNLFETKSNELDDLGVTETICEVNPQGGGVESYYVVMPARITLKSRIGSVDLDLQVVIEFRRSGITKPAVMVTSLRGKEIESEGDVLIIPTDNDKTVTIVCLAEAASKPIISGGRLTKGGVYQPLKKSRFQNEIYYVSLNLASFSLKSPRLSEEGEYICSAATGVAVTNQKFTLLRYVAVEVTTNRTSAVPLETIENKQYSLTCEATGIPQPYIAFYWTPKFAFPSGVKHFQKLNKDRVIYNSDVFEMTTRVEGTKTYGRIIVKDMKKVIASLPTDFWDSNSVYEIVCFASNEYSYKTKVLGHFYKPSDFDSNHPVNATRFSLFR